MSQASNRQPKGRRWIGTLNNYTDDELTEWVQLAELVMDSKHDTLSYLAFQEEIAPETGTPHLQVYLIVNDSLRRRAVQRALPAGMRMHLEPARGNHEQCKKYCTKEESRKPDGVSLCGGKEPSPGRRNDLVRVKEMLDAGAKEAEIADEFFGQWVRYHKAFQRYRGIKLPNRTEPTFTTVYWGPPGTGKTRAAFDEAGPDAYWLPKPNGSRVFWDGYEGQENVVIDEFFGWMPRDLMCRICDRYPFRVETKGGSVPFVAKRIWITSNSPPCEWWTRIGLGPMRRRLTSPLGVSLKITGNGRRERAQHGLDLSEPRLIE
jgi:hypothetical protein